MAISKIRFISVHLIRELNETKPIIRTMLKIESLYINGQQRWPDGHVVQDPNGRWLRYCDKDKKVTLGKLNHEPKDIDGSRSLAERCRTRTGVSSISWYSWGRDVIEISVSDLSRVDDVMEAYKAEGYPIEMITY